MKVELYSDGAARGNPEGPGGFGCILRYTDSKDKLHEKEISKGYVKTTNNRMELMGVIAGLEALNRPCEVEVYSDSKYVTEAFNQKWIDNWVKNGWRKADKKAVLNVDLWKRLLKDMEPHSVTFNWVKGHDGNEINERCDKLATAAADSDDLSEDIMDQTV
ncbi:MAG: ribonuclease HI [Lachnospiraceae bacterium]|nr:ribonuclease HI [Lachnospiraceae bacterium]